MSDMTTGARPYAKAVFELAGKAGSAAAWSETLQFLAIVASDEAVVAVLEAPRYTKEQRAELIINIGGDQLDDQAKNLVRLLAENGRLMMLPTIAQLFEVYRSEAEGAQEVKVVSFRKLTQKQEADLAASLERRFGSKVSMVYEVDAELLGGAIIYAGDLVIDGSVRGKMNKLANALLH